MKKYLFILSGCLNQHPTNFNTTYEQALKLNSYMCDSLEEMRAILHQYQENSLVSGSYWTGGPIYSNITKEVIATLSWNGRCWQGLGQTVDSEMTDEIFDLEEAFEYGL